MTEDATFAYTVDVFAQNFKIVDRLTCCEEFDLPDGNRAIDSLQDFVVLEFTQLNPVDPVTIRREYAYPLSKFHRRVSRPLDHLHCVSRIVR